jgi:hypothetical protein
VGEAASPVHGRITLARVIEIGVRGVSSGFAGIEAMRLTTAMLAVVTRPTIV